MSFGEKPSELDRKTFYENDRRYKASSSVAQISFTTSHKSHMVLHQTQTVIPRTLYTHMLPNESIKIKHFTFI